MFTALYPARREMRLAQTAEISLRKTGARSPVDLADVGSMLFGFNRDVLQNRYPAESARREVRKDFFAMQAAAIQGDEAAKAAYLQTAANHRRMYGSVLSAVRYAAGATALSGEMMDPTVDEIDAFGRLVDGSGSTLLSDFGSDDVEPVRYRSAVTTQATYLTLEHIGLALPTTPVYGHNLRAVSV